MLSGDVVTGVLIESSYKLEIPMMVLSLRRGFMGVWFKPIPILMKSF